MRAALLALFSLAAVGCDREERDECEAAHVDCPNEPATTLADRCRAAPAEGCAGEDRALFRCLRDHQVCDGRGRMDMVASEARCLRESAALATCVGVDAATDGPADVTADADAAEDVAAQDAEDGDVRDDAPTE